MARPDVSFQTAAQRISQSMRASRALKKSVNVRKEVFSPASIMHLAFKAHLSYIHVWFAISAHGGRAMGCSDRRQTQRFPAKLRIIYVNDGDYLISHTRDLSVDGMFICTKKTIPVGAATEITFSLGDRNEVSVPARVVWVNNSGDEDDTGIGVQFVNPSPDMQDAMLHMINRIALLEA